MPTDNESKEDKRAKKRLEEFKTREGYTDRKESIEGTKSIPACFFGHSFKKFTVLTYH